MRRRVYTEDYKLGLVERVRRGKSVSEVAEAAGVSYGAVWRWCQEQGVSVHREQRDRTRMLEVWIPSNRYDHLGRPTHMDGWNEIVDAYKKSRYRGASRELENVEHVAAYVARAMRGAGWPRMNSKENASPCHVTITFVERDKRRDIGNVHGGAKYALDALTHRHSYGASAIYDDSQRWLTKIAYKVAVDAKKPGMMIVVRTNVAGV